jgi:hypothetical protein
LLPRARMVHIDLLRAMLLGFVGFGLSIYLLFAESGIPGLSGSSEYLRNGWSAISSGQNGSFRERMVGSWELALTSINESPGFGIGIGGANLEAFIDEHGGGFEFKNSLGGISNCIAAVTVGAGPLAGLAYAGLLILLASKSTTRVLGIGLLALTFFSGDPFTSHLWWYIALGVTIYGSAWRRREVLSTSISSGSNQRLATAV